MTALDKQPKDVFRYLLRINKNESCYLTYYLPEVSQLELVSFTSSIIYLRQRAVVYVKKSCGS